MPIIELDEVRLRALEPKDVPMLYQYRNDPEITRNVVGFSAHYSHANLTSWIEYHAGRTDEVLWAIAIRSDDRCIGHVGLYQIDSRIRRAEFGILIGDQGWQGKGVGRAVTRAVLTFAFRELNLHRVGCDVLATNKRAIHTWESVGFKLEGRIRDAQFRDGAYVDVLNMSMLESEWGP